MQITNNYEMQYVKYEENGMYQEGTGVFNGDIGYITRIEPETFEVTITFDDGKVCKYPKTELHQITLAYAITIHKSQGSEYPCVIIPLFEVPSKLIYRNLLYTAVTRAKRLLVMVGSKEVWDNMAENNRKTLRYTLLQHFLKENMRYESF